MIEDKELRRIFKMESEEIIQNINRELLLMEKDPKNQENMEEFLREVHSIKGAGRMMGILEIETAAHQIEEVFEKLKSEDAIITSDKIDVIFIGLDAIRQFVNEAVTGKPSCIKVADVIALLSNKEKEPVPVDTDVSHTSSDRLNETDSTVTKPEPDPAKYQIDSIRVETEKLDILMTLASELVVSKTNIIRRLADIDKIIELWDGLNSNRSANNFLIRDIEQDNNKNNRSVNKLTDFLNLEWNYLDKMEKLIRQIKSQFYGDNERLSYIVDELGDKISNIRLLPLSTLFNLFLRNVRDLSKSMSKEVELVITGGETKADKRIIEKMKAPITHIISNAIDHGIEMPDERKELGKPGSGTISINAYQTGTNIVIEIKDDGAGLNTDAIISRALKQRIVSEEALSKMNERDIWSLIYSSGFSTGIIVTEVSGRGIGLDVVRNNIDNLKGTIDIESSTGKGTKFSIKLPVVLATTRVLILREKDRMFALPTDSVETNRIISQKDIFSIERCDTIMHDGYPVSVSYLSDLLELNPDTYNYQMPKELTCVMLSIGNEKFGFLVDALLDEREVILKPHGAILKRVRNVLGTAILGTGELCIVLNPNDLGKTVKKHRFQTSAPVALSAERAEEKKSILLVEDSISTRTQEKRILESASYDVVTAVDGIDGLNKLNTRAFNAVVSDIQMPNMDGWTLTEKIRKEKKYKDIPIILVTSLSSDEEKKRGIELGADAYVSKAAFDQKTFLDIIGRLV